jgi:SagB-type dehydrogenase family enzyme
MPRIDEPWTAAQIEDVLETVRERLETERREQFVAFDVPMDCYWPASRIYHQHSSMGPETQFRLTLPEVEAFTLNLDYKVYPGAARIPLSHPEPVAVGLENAIRRRHSERSFSPQPVSLDTLAKLLELGCGVTKEQQVPRRAAPSPGGLYAVETYALAFSVEGLSRAIYHYAVLDHALELVRPVPGPEVLQPFLPPVLSKAEPAVVLALSVIFPRVQTKYLERGYRFALLEAGHIAQNFLLTATALNLSAVPVGGFWDEPLNSLMGFESTTEALVYFVFIGPRRKDGES